MWIALLGLVAVVAVLLYRLVLVQEARVRLEAKRVVDETARDLALALARGWEDARKNRRIIEWLDDTARALEATANEVWTRLHSTHGDELRGLLVVECLERGVHSRFLDENDFAAYKGHPGPDPSGAVWCPTGYCDQERDVVLPVGLELCPFCGNALELLDDGEDSERWKSDMQTFERYRRLFPSTAAKDEAESLRAHGEAAKRDAAKYQAALAAHRSKVEADEVDIDVDAD